MSSKASWQTYQDFVIQIDPTEEGSYRVEASGPTGEAETSFTLPFDEKDLEIFLLKVGHPRKVTSRGLVPEPIQLTQEFGTKLFRSVIKGRVRDIFATARHGVDRDEYGLRLQLRLTKAPELADLPWEFLHDGQDFLALLDNTPLVRYVDLPNPPRPLKVIPPLRILVTISAPHNLPPLDVEDEKSKVQEALADLAAQGLVDIDFTPNGTLSTLQSTLRQARAKGTPFHVWHYIGHGTFDQTQDASVLAFCDDSGMSYLVTGSQLGPMFRSCREMRMVLLNACDGARSDPRDPFAGVAMSLVKRGIPAVIGMQFEISDQAAKRFSSEFYQALVDGLPVDAALAQARLSVFYMPNWVEWATPVLFMRSPDGQIFDFGAPIQPAAISPPPKPPQTAEPDIDTREQEAKHKTPTHLSQAPVLLRTLERLDSWVEAVEFSPDGKRLAACTRRSSIYLWWTADWSLLHKKYSDARCIAFAPDGETLAIGGHDVAYIRQVSNGSLLSTLNCLSVVKSVWNLVKNNSPLMSFRLADEKVEVTSLAFSPDGTILATGGSYKYKPWLRLWRVSDGEVLNTWTHRGGKSLAFSPDGTLLATAPGPHLYRLSNQSWSSEFEIDSAGHVAFSPEGDILACTGVDGIIQFARVPGGNKLCELTGHTKAVRSIAFSPDGKMLALGSSDKTVRLWHVADKKLLHTLEGHTDDVNDVAFSPDGMMLASASDDKTIRIWRLK